ncbi:MAG: hypothetical protein OHK0029_40550 [Armatimonadaceae bacterium]
MATITLEVPDEIAEGLQQIPKHELAQYLSEIVEDYELLPPLSPEDLESIGRGLADADAGRVVPADVVFARLKQRVNPTNGHRQK